jgi:hypothetical protein
MGQMYQCWCRICREINFFFRFEYHMFYPLYPFVTYLLTLHIITSYKDTDITYIFYTRQNR